jgi:hypothetical protein
MLGVISESVKANMAATTVLLGLTPTILASLGPPVAEVSLLSLRRPLLTLSGKKMINKLTTMALTSVEHCLVYQPLIL